MTVFSSSLCSQGHHSCFGEWGQGNRCHTTWLAIQGEWHTTRATSWRLEYCYKSWLEWQCQTHSQGHSGISMVKPVIKFSLCLIQLIRTNVIGAVLIWVHAFPLGSLIHSYVVMLKGLPLRCTRRICAPLLDRWNVSEASGWTECYQKVQWQHICKCTSANACWTEWTRGILGQLVSLGQTLHYCKR